MAVESSTDFASYMDDWGESFEWNGVVFKMDFAAHQADRLDPAAEEATGWVLSDAVPLLADDDRVVRVSTGITYRILQIDKDSVAYPTPGWALKLEKL